MSAATAVARVLVRKEATTMSKVSLNGRSATGDALVAGCRPGVPDGSGARPTAAGCAAGVGGGAGGWDCVSVEIGGASAFVSRLMLRPSTQLATIIARTPAAIAPATMPL